MDTSGARSRSTTAIYHLADARLGGAFPFLGEAGAAHRAHLRDTFTRVVDQALDLTPSVVLITGNLFGTPFPPRDLTEFVRTQIARLARAGIQVLIAAGPLDHLYDKTYASGALNDLDHVSVFPTTPKVVTLPEHGVTIVGVSWAAGPVSTDFLATASAHRGQGRYLVAACAVAWPDSGEGLGLLRRQVAASGASYLAIGGSPVRRNLSSDRVSAWCPGAPDLVAPEEGEGSPLLIVPAGNEVIPKPVARRRFARFTLQPNAYATTDELATAIRALGDQHLAAVVRLSGASRINQHIDVVALRDRLAREFLALDIIDESRPTLDDVDAATYPELSVAGKFVSVVRAEMERASTEEARRRASAALRLGLALLEGRVTS